MSSSALVSIPVGVVVERRKAVGPWCDFVWRATSVLDGAPATPPWAILGQDGDVTLFYAGAAEIELHRSETGNYLGNLRTGAPLLWVILRPTGTEPPFDVLAVTGDPAEGEAYTEPGNDLVDTVPMPDTICERVEAFVAEHHVERPFVKRQRDRAEPQALARRKGAWENE